jgi:hypothetical protein
MATLEADETITGSRAGKASEANRLDHLLRREGKLEEAESLSL